MTELKGSCHMCGKCCEAIHLPIGIEEVKDMAERNRNADAIFIRDNWTPISKEEALIINPYLAENERDVQSEFGVSVYDVMHFYTCKQHNRETKQCKVHDARPRVCSGYPWYERGPHPNNMWYSAECGYRIDVEVEHENIGR